MGHVVFNKYFQMIPAVTEELKREVYKLRYQVYCTETGFEDHDKFPDYLETDEYDSRSSHYLVRHRKLGIYMATTRIILPDAEKLFPIEKHSLIDRVDLLKTMPRSNLAELSRFCVSKELRQRKDEQQQEEKRSAALLTIALFACAIRMSSQNNIHYWYAIMEPTLLRAVSMLGIHFIKVGPPVDYHGLRIPCVIKIADLLDSIEKKDLNSWRMLTDDTYYSQDDDLQVDPKAQVQLGTNHDRQTAAI